MAASSVGSGSGAGASLNGLPSLSTFVARRSTAGRSGATVHPNPGV